MARLPSYTILPYTTLFRSTLNKEIADSANWKIDLKVDHLTGAAEEVNEIMDRAFELRATHDWDYVISLTDLPILDRKSTRLNSSHVAISYAVFCLKKRKIH